MKITEKGKKKTNRPSICWLTLQMTIMAEAGQGQNQEPGASGSPVWVQGLRWSAAAFPDH